MLSNDEIDLLINYKWRIENDGILPHKDKFRSGEKKIMKRLYLKQFMVKFCTCHGIKYLDGIKSILKVNGIE